MIAMTVKELSKDIGIAPASLRRKIERRGLGKFGVNDELPMSVVSEMSDREIPHAGNGITNDPNREGYESPDDDGNSEAETESPDDYPEPTKNESGDPEKTEKPEIKFPPKRPRFPEKRPETEPEAQGEQAVWRQVLAVAPLPMLGLAASYGVYFFASRFVPTWVAIVEAGGFEMVYIGLAGLQGMSKDVQRRANLISLGAVLVSIIYNAMAGALEMEPTLLDNLSPFWFWTIAIIHGSPLALLAYFVANLTLHK